MYGAAIFTSSHDWTQKLSAGLLPGSNVVVLSSKEGAAIEGRRAGLLLRDTLLVLRPHCCEFALFFRTPIDKGTERSGSGAINIDACRVRWRSEAERLSALPGSMPRANESVGTFQTRDRTVERPEDFQSPLGRWPSNILIVHGPGCRLEGGRRIEGHKGYPNGPGGSSTQFSQKGTKTTRNAAWAGHADADGHETVPSWVCEDACLARRLDASVDSLGGATRFYPQFQDTAELLAWLRQLVSIPGAPTLET